MFRGGTDLVEVDVVVHGRNGAFVSDLTVADFVLEEEGRPQTIEQFYVRTADGGGPSPGTAPSTSASAPGSAPRVFVVVFDTPHLTPGGFKRTQAAAQSLFSKQFRAGDIGGVVSGGRMFNNRLTSEREELLKAVKDAKPDSSSSSRLFDERSFPRLSEIEAIRIVRNNDREVLAAAIQRACAEDPDFCRRIDPEPSVRSKASQLAQTARVESERTLQTLRVLAEGLARIEGRKTVLLMSEGFMAEESWPLVHDVVTLATRANARLYTFDARGLGRGMRSLDDVAPGAEDANARMLAQMDFGADSVNSLAVDTGGFVVRNTNLFDGAIARIADDVNNYYVLGYRPAAPPDGKFHRISVKVKRPGVAVRARRGYVAMPRTDAVTTKATDTPVPAEPVRGARSESTERSRETPALESAATTVTGTIVARPEGGAGYRVRPDAEAHARQLGPPTPDADATAGWEAYQRGDVESARTKLALAAARPAAPAWVHYTLGMSTYALGQYRDAAASWERVRSGAPDFEPVYFDLIDAYLQLKEHDRAIRTARAALERWPTDPEIFEALGVVQTVRGALDDAIKSFESAITIGPGDATGYFNLAKALELRYVRSRRYVEQLRSWVANDSDRTSAIANYQRYLELGGAYADAARAGLTRLSWVPTPK